jgi:hypothetical protein
MLLFALIPRKMVDKLRSAEDWMQPGQRLVGSGTPAERILAACAHVLQGAMPKAADVVFIRAALLASTNGRWQLKQSSALSACYLPGACTPCLLAACSVCADRPAGSDRPDGRRGVCNM